MEEYYEIIDDLLQRKEGRQTICQFLTQSSKKWDTLLLDTTTYLDQTDLSFDIRFYIIYDQKKTYFIIGVGEEKRYVYYYLLRKIRKQIEDFHPHHNGYSTYFDLHDISQEKKDKDC